MAGPGREERRFERELAELRPMIGDDPAAAIGLLDDLVSRARAEGADVAAARAAYAAAQATAAAGDFVAALDRVGAARVALAAADDAVGALRTGLGRAHILNEMGRHDEATEECEAILRALAIAPPAGLAPDERADLTARAQQNLGACLELRGRWDAALEAYARAEAVYEELDDIEGLGNVLHNRAAILFAIGRTSEAEHDYSRAIGALADDPIGLIYALGGLAEVKLARGALTDALTLVARATDVRRTGDLPLADTDRLLVAGRVYEALQLHDEALGSYADAAGFLDGAGLVVDRARALWGMARAHAAADEFDRAHDLLAEAIEVFRESGHRQWTAGCLLDAALVEERAGHPAPALELAAASADLATACRATIDTVRAELAVARLADVCGDAVSARQALDRARQAAESLELSPIDALVDGAAGLAALRRGDLDEAESLLERAATSIEESGALTPDVVAGRRAAFATLDIFDGLITLGLRRAGGPQIPGTLQRALERARRQRLGTLVRRGGPTESVADDRGLTSELDSIYAAMLQPAADPVIADRLRDRARELEVRRSRTRLASLGAGGSGAVVDQDLPDETVPPGETILSWYILDGEVLAMVGTVDGWHGVRSVTTADSVVDLLDRLDTQWQHVRSGLAVRHMARLERSCRAVLSELHDELIAPVGDLLPATAAAPVVIAAHGPLHRVPFHALHDGSAYLAERFTTSMTPSVADYLRRRQVKTTGSNRAVVLGAGDATTPAVAAEVAAVGGQLTDVSLHLGAAATSTALLGEAPGAAIVHLAGHAVFRRDNPMFSSLQLHDRWLAAHELLGADLTGALVTLSACESGRSDGHGEELAGLTRAVLGAGARTLIASLWPADDAATASLMAALYRHLRIEGPADALRRAQLELSAEHPHPYFWAPFVTIGGR